MAYLSVSIVFATLAAAIHGQAINGFFNVPSTMFRKGGRVNFQGLSLGQVCQHHDVWW